MKATRASARDCWRPTSGGVCYCACRGPFLPEPAAKGLKNREIAARLGMSSNVVRNHISKIYDEVGVHNRVQLALWYEVQIHERMVGYPETGQKRACGKLVERFSDLG